MKKSVLIVAIVAGLAAVMAFTRVGGVIHTFVRVRILETGTEDERVRLPSSAATNVRLDSWQLKRMLELPVLVCHVYNGGDWVVSSVDVRVSSATEARTFRCFLAPAVEYQGTFVYGQREVLTPKKSGTAVCEVGTFVTKDSRVTLEAVYGWKP